jgi:nicotinamidase-related amidase
MPATVHARHPQLLNAADTLLMVIDLQEALMRVIWDRDRVVTNVCILMEGAAAIDAPLLVTTQNKEKLGEPIPEVLKRLPPGGAIYDKMTFSCLGSDSICKEVARAGKKQVLLCGVETHVCVHQTAHDLLAAGYQVHVAADAVSSRRQANWLTAVSRMETSGIVVTTTEMGLYEMLYRAGTPEFRRVLPLVR